MKKVIALISFFLFAAFANIKPIATPEKPYNPEGVYTGDIHAETDYQKLYQEYIGSTQQAGDVCDINPVSYISNLPAPIVGSGRRPWFVPEMTEEELSTLGNGEDTTDISLGDIPGRAIILPVAGQIVTSANASRHGSFLSVKTVSGITFNFQNLSRWYCCRDRAPAISTDKGSWKTQFSHTADAKGTYLSQNCIVGYTSKESKVSISDSNGETMTFGEFFGS